MIESSHLDPSAAAAAVLRAASPLVVLGGDHQLRPAGLERDLLRAGFQMAETEEGQLTARCEMILHLTTSQSTELFASALSKYADARAAGAQVMLLVVDGVPDDLIRAAEAGADDAIVLPSEASLLVARLRARLAAPRASRHSPDTRDLKLFEVVQQVATELNRDEMLHALVRSLGQALELRSVSCLLHSCGGGNGGRLVAATDAPKVRDADVELDRWPEAVAAHANCATVYLRDVATSPLFLAVGPRFAGGGPARDLESTAAIPLQSLGRAFGSLVMRTHRGEAPLTQAQITFAELAVAATTRLIEADDRRGAIARRQSLAAHVDPLTGCGTLDALDSRIREEFERARRYQVTFALVLLDVDGMRLINDRLGRDRGHRVLAELGRLLQRELRAPDFVARYGGEEFLLLLPETDLEGGRRTVHRIRESLLQGGPNDLPNGLRCELTAGVAVYPHPSVHKPEDLFAMVEAAMLAGKAQDVDRIGSAA